MRSGKAMKRLKESRVSGVFEWRRNQIEYGVDSFNFTGNNKLDKSIAATCTVEKAKVTGRPGLLRVFSEFGFFSKKGQREFQSRVCAFDSIWSGIGTSIWRP